MNEQMRDISIIGKSVKAFDFKPMEGREDCYLIGTAKRFSKELGWWAIVVEVTGGDHYYASKSIGNTVFIPLEIDFGDFEGRISLV